MLETVPASFHTLLTSRRQASSKPLKRSFHTVCARTQARVVYTEILKVVPHDSPEGVACLDKLA